MNNKYFYRIIRLRRLIIACLLAIFVQWSLGWWLFGPSALLQAPLIRAGAALFCITVIMSLVLTYPRVWWETLTTAIVLGLVLMLFPLFETLQATAPDHNRGQATAWLIFGVVFGGFFLWLGLNWLPSTFEKYSLGTKRMYSRIRTGIPPNEAFQILKSAPDSADDRTKSGPVGENGLFLVNTNVNTVNAETLEPEVEMLSYYCRIEQEDDLNQVISVYHEIDGEARVEVEYLSVRPAGRMTICEKRTVFDQANIHAEAGFWLTDFAGDHMYGQLMRAQGRESIALVDLPHTSPLVGLARFFEQFNDDPPSRSGGSV